MTTNHRPTFESRRGRELAATAIVHARALPAHKQLKFRKHKDGTAEKEASEKLAQLKRELRAREGSHMGEDRMVEAGDKKEEEEEKEKEVEKEDEETYAQKRRRIQLESAEVDASDDESEGDHGNNSEDGTSDSESDSEDEAALIAELQKIKRERAERQLEEERQQRREAALTSNPLLNKPVTGAKKSWRHATAFRSTQSAKKEDDADEYINDALRSDFHARFLDRYIR